jgi:hypothetical protein
VLADGSPALLVDPTRLAGEGPEPGAAAPAGVAG